MKKSVFPFSLLMTVAVILVSLSSCSWISDESDIHTGDREYLLNDWFVGKYYERYENVSVPSDAFFRESPCKIVVFEKNCGESWHYGYETLAYIINDNPKDADGLKLFYLDSPRGSNHTYVRATAYWPSDAKVEFDKEGNVLSADCVVMAQYGACFAGARGWASLSFYPVEHFTVDGFTGYLNR